MVFVSAFQNDCHCLRSKLVKISWSAIHMVKVQLNQAMTLLVLDLRKIPLVSDQQSILTSLLLVRET